MANMFRGSGGGNEGDGEAEDSPPSFGCVVLAVTMYYFFLVSAYTYNNVSRVMLTPPHLRPRSSG